MPSYRLSDRRRLIQRVVALCLLLSGVVFLLDAHDLLDRAELWGLDQRFRMRGPRHARERTQVVVVGIDDYSINRLAGEYGGPPLPRSVHARLIDRLTDAGARVIAFDILFSGRDHHASVGKAD